MFTVIRNYKGSKTFADELKQRSKEIETLISAVPGFIAYYLVKTDDGCLTVTVCENRAGCDDSTQRAAKYVRENLSNLKVAAPEVMSGDLLFKFAKYPSHV